MSVVRVKGIQRYRDNRDGKWYCYHRKTGKRIRSEYGTPAFFLELDELNTAHKKAKEQDELPKTFGEMVKLYLKNDIFTRLAPRTKRDYTGDLNSLAYLSDMPLSQFDRPWMARFRDLVTAERSWHQANAYLAVLGVMFKLAAEYGCMANNPVEKLTKARKPKGRREANRPWTDAERRVVLERLPPHLRLPVAIGRWTGLREGDVLTLPRNVIKDGWLRHHTSKSSGETEVVIPVFPDFQKELDTARAHEIKRREERLAKKKPPKPEPMTLCVTSRGDPWTESGFRCSFRKELAKLEAEGLIGPDLTFHGLRHTVGGELAEHGISDGGIALWLGQKTLVMAAHYSRRADKQKRMEATVLTLKNTGGAVA